MASIGVDASTTEANAALRAIVRRADGEGYREMLERLAKESGIATPTAEDLVRLDRRRKGKRLSNTEWTSPTDPEARIAKLKDGRTRLAYKPEHAVDLDPGAIVAAAIHPADRGDTATLPGTLEAAEANLAAVGAAPTPEDPAELVADKGYHSRDGLKELEDGAWKSRIAEKKAAGVSRWRGDTEARRAVYNNRARLRSGVAKEAFRLRAELVERSFALVLDRGGMRRAWLRGGENLKKRYLVHVAGYNLGLVMRLLVGAGTPREFLARAAAHLLLLTAGDGAVVAILVVATDTEAAILVVSVQPGPATEAGFLQRAVGGHGARRCGRAVRRPGERHLHPGGGGTPQVQAAIAARSRRRSRHAARRGPPCRGRRRRRAAGRRVAGCPVRADCSGRHPGRHGQRRQPGHCARRPAVSGAAPALAARAHAVPRPAAADDLRCDACGRAGRCSAELPARRG